MKNRARKSGLDSPFTFSSKRKTSARICDWPGCASEAEHRTNKSPREMGTHVWYCVDHIRQHNKSWNYFEGLSDDEVEAAIKNDTVWQRPTWELGSKADRAKAKAFAAGARVRDDFGFFNDASDTPGTHKYSRTFHPDTPEAKAFAILDLAPPVTLEDVKMRYKKLVKKHHPDANGGSKDAEEKFKEIGLAYQTIMQHLGT